MAKEIKAFVTNDSFIDNTQNVISPLMEISDISLTYSRTKQQYFSTENSLFSLYVFKILGGTSLTQTESDDILRVISSLNTFLTTTQTATTVQSIILFTNNYNVANPTANVSNLTYNNIVNVNGVNSVDYVSFTVNNVSCNIWLSDNIFKIFYPEYDVSIVLPFNNFSGIVNNASAFITALDSFNLLNFNVSIENNKNNNPTTYSKILNIPYMVPNSNIYKNCYFGFNIYGLQGNYEYILKLALYDYLTVTVGMLPATVELLFPSILSINEFFITPRWDKIAIPSQVGQNGINSQVAYAFNEVFDINKFVKVYTDLAYLRNNTYSVPFDYNNLMLHVTNGYYTDIAIKDFKTYFNDLLAVTSTHPDFARMKTVTQKFITLLENMLNVSDSNNSTELFNKIIGNTNYKFTVITRNAVTYISYFYDKHQIYVVPKYEILKLV